MPHFHAETDCLKLPEKWVMGDVSAVAVDSKNRIWVLQRPRSLAADQRSKAAPPVLLFSADGRFISGFGGLGKGYDWPLVEHSLAIDTHGHVWIAGNARPAGGAADDMMLEFTSEARSVAPAKAAVMPTWPTSTRRPTYSSMTNSTKPMSPMAMATGV
jgi:hypothetical protein